MSDDEADPRTLERARHGDRDAFGEAVRPFSDGLFAFLARAVGDRHDAEDLLQETLIRAWRGLDTYRHRGRFAGWLFTIARNVVRDRARAAPRPVLVPADAGLPDPSPDPLDHAVAGRLEADLEEALGRLPEARRSVFLLRRHADLTFREISELMEIPLGTALSHMHLAVKSLREELRHHE